MKQSVLILAHGSRDSEARAEYQRLAEAIATRLPGVLVHFSVLEFPGDGLLSIPEGVARCAEAGAERIIALPYFLFAAGHVREDLPGELEEGVSSWPGVQVSYQPPLGVDSRLLDVLESRAVEAEDSFPVDSGATTAMLLVGAGTSDPDSNADLYRAARLLWERRRYPLVEVAFVSLTQPRVSDALLRCLSLGATRVVVVPYFLNTGVLSRRIASQLETSRQQLPDLSTKLGGEIGLHPSLLGLLTERARTGLASEGAGLSLPPCADNGAPWACWLERSSSGAETP